MPESRSAILSFKTEYYVFLPKIRASLAQNTSQVKQIRQIHQIQFQATVIRHNANGSRLVPAWRIATHRTWRSSYAFRPDGMDGGWLYGGFPVRLQEDAYIGIEVGVYEEGLKIG